MIRVVFANNEQLDTRVFDLARSTISQICQLDMTFCYDQEFDEITVYTAMQSPDQSITVFVKLVDGEPVDLSIEEWKEQWNRFPEWIPADI